MRRRRDCARCVLLGALLGSVLGSGSAATAQDSVGTSASSGDALDAYRTPDDQRVDFVLDLTPFNASWGGAYAIGPVLKASRSTFTVYRTHLIGSTATSVGFDRGAGFLSDSYALWNTPGAGVNTLRNAAPASDVATATATGDRFAISLMEFGEGPGVTPSFGDGDDESNLVTGIISLSYRAPNRLHVSRVNSATNKTAQLLGNSATASFGLGGVDADGTVHALADGFGLEASDAIADRRFLRIDNAGRDASVVNSIEDSGANDAPSTATVFGSVTNKTTPTLLPARDAGRPVLVATDMASEYLFEQAPGSVVPTDSYLSGFAGSPRGGLRFIDQPASPLNDGTDDAGLGITLVRADGAAMTRSIVVFGVNTDGSVDAGTTVELPATPGTLVDPVDGYDPAITFGPASAFGFTGFESQASFRGANGPVSATVLPDGDILAAATVRLNDSFQDMVIAVCRLDPTSGAQEWLVAAHTGDGGGAGGVSKVLRGDFGDDGIPGTLDTGEGDGVLDAAPIGRIALALETGSAAPTFSAPAMDRSGNLYFLTSLSLNRSGGPLLTRGLVRANAGAAGGGYELELLLAEGDVFAGQHSDRDYSIERLAIADGDSIDSSTIFASSIVQDTIDGVDAGATATGDPMSLGVLAVRAQIRYDSNDDGDFDDAELYDVVLALMPRIVPGDYDRSGAVDVLDLLAFLADWFVGTIDYNLDGGVDVLDLLEFLGDWFVA